MSLWRPLFPLVECDPPAKLFERIDEVTWHAVDCRMYIDVQRADCARHGDVLFATLHYYDEYAEQVDVDVFRGAWVTEVLCADFNYSLD